MDGCCDCGGRYGCCAGRSILVVLTVSEREEEEERKRETQERFGG